jgi:hypothetical protein
MLIIEDPTVTIKVRTDNVTDNRATDDISHVTCLLFAFECVHHVGRSQQIKSLRLYFNRLDFEA